MSHNESIVGDGPDRRFQTTFKEAKQSIDKAMGEGTTDSILKRQGIKSVADDAIVTFSGDTICLSQREEDIVRDAPEMGTILDTVIFPDQYPDGNPKTAAGMKKPDISVVPPAGILHLATAMMNGAEKYGPFNWRDKPISTRPYVAAAMRHLLSYLDGEDFSADTVAAGKPVHHLGHVLACCAILLDAEEVGVLNDNRPGKGVAGKMIETFNETGRLRG